MTRQSVWCDRWLLCLQVVWDHWSDLYCSPIGPANVWLLLPCAVWSVYRWYWGVGLTSIVLLLVLLMCHCFNHVLFDLFTGGIGALVWSLLFSWWSSYCVIGDCFDPVLFDLFTGGTGALVWSLLFSWWSSYCVIGDCFNPVFLICLQVVRGRWTDLHCSPCGPPTTAGAGPRNLQPEFQHASHRQRMCGVVRREHAHGVSPHSTFNLTVVLKMHQFMIFVNINL